MRFPVKRWWAVTLTKKKTQPTQVTLPIFESKLHETEAAQRHSVLSKYNRNYFEILKTMHSLLRFFFWGIYSTPTDLIKLLQNSTFPVGQRQKAAECCAKKKTLRSTSSTAFTLKGHFGRRITATSFPLLRVHLREKPFNRCNQEEAQVEISFQQQRVNKTLPVSILHTGQP